MRVELEQNHMSLNEFIDSLGALREPVELTRDGEVVAMLSSTKGKEKNLPSRQKRRTHSTATPNAPWPPPN